jgi:hypothetical protein
MLNHFEGCCKSSRIALRLDSRSSVSVHAQFGGVLDQPQGAFRPSEGAFGDPRSFEWMVTEGTPQPTCGWATSPRLVGEGLSFNGEYG